MTPAPRSSTAAVLVWLVVVIASAMVAAPASAQSGQMAPGSARTGRSPLERAQQALATGDHQRAARLAEALSEDRRLSDPTRAEAYRVLALARFFSGDRPGTKRAFVGYLELDADAHLDPALVPPEAIVVLEEVRAEKAAALAAARPKPRRRPALNLLPPFGQFQNGDTLKGGIIAGAGLALIATNLTSYGLLASWCRDSDGTCPDRRDQARAARIVNLTSFGLLAGVYAYGVIDGFVVMRRQAREEAMRVQLVPTDGGAAVVVGGRF